MLRYAEEKADIKEIISVINETILKLILIVPPKKKTECC